ncbi:MAG: bifunctional helix-turn-helix transcriptional regulator/GNAT family N-acetyltransferase [Gemmatimonadetes bacterium]|nr:bifunctional helix-turn-helix transcriptional regulator/GNAT family N-acetyltransferase [Gemmatimonadota bacterium]
MPVRRPPVPAPPTLRAATTPGEIARVRRFNRFYTARLRLLDRSHLESSLTLTEVRLLYELSHRDHPTARDLGVALALDEGQLSRLIAALKRRGLVRATTGDDRRQRRLALTARGTRAFAVLDTRASTQVRSVLDPLAPSDRGALLEAMAGIEVLLSPTVGAARAPEIVLRSPLPGDLGWVIERHGAVYAAEYGWDASFERLVAGIVSTFEGDDPAARERCWIATVDGRRAGCVFLMRKSASVAKLRILLVEPWARGLGLGGTLVRACIAGATELGYRRLTLWTNSVLSAARRIYEREGFVLMDEARHRSFGADLVGQTWERDLTPARPVTDARRGR